MGRETKFRVWDKKNKIMIYQDDDKCVWEMPNKHRILSVRQKSVSIIFEDDDASDRSSYELEEGEFELMQDTGLKDRNDVDIYRGDIVQWPNESTEDKDIPAGMGFVKFHPEYLRFDVGWKHQKDPSFGTQALLSDIKSCVEVIGNIYENSDLISKQD